MLKRKLCAAVTVLGVMVPAFAAQSEERFHPVEKVCIQYEVTGQLMNGDMLRCHRKYGLESFEIQNTEIGIGNIKQKQSSHNITIADKVYAIDTVTNTGTETVNPMYEQFRAAISERGQSAEGIGGMFISAMGFTPDGTSRNIGGVVCNGYRSPAVGSACFTEDFLILEQDFLGNKQTAVRVAIGEDGGDDNYTLWQRVNIRKGPDLSNGLNIQELLKQRGVVPQQ